MRKRLLILTLIIAMVTCLGACGKKTDTPEGQVEEESQVENIITVGEKGASEDEIMFYMLCIKEQYEGYFGKDIWDVSFGKKTFLDMCKDDVLGEIVQLKVITAKAEELGIVVTEDEVEEIADTVRQQMDEINDEDKARYHITTELLEKIYHDNYLSSKTFDVVTADVNTSVSDEQARVASFEVLTLNYEPSGRQEVLLKADELQKQATAEGTDFYSLATVHSNEPEIQYTIPEGVMEKAFDRAAFSLKTGEISGVIVGDEKCYIVHCLNELDEDETAENKEKIINERQTEAFKKVYEGWAKDYGVKVDEEKWKEINMN